MIKNITGQKFGRLTAIKNVGKLSKDSRVGLYYWLCKCDCGNKKNIQGSLLRRGVTKSCGCLAKEILLGRNITHGLTPRNNHPRIYNTWSSMKARCNRMNLPEYRFYGALGIKVCKRWNSFENFLEDMGKSYEQHCKDFGIKQTTIDRIDGTKGYSPENCRWATKVIQAGNMKSNVFFEIDGQRKHMAEWSRIYKICNKVVSARVKSGWTIIRALTEKPFIGKNQFS